LPEYAPLKIFLPRQLRPFVKGLLARVGFGAFKYTEELNYWRQRFQNGTWILEDYYEERLLALAKESSQDFLAGKVVADLGCGPRGSLNWATRARLRIGIDVLSDLYSEFDIANQNMVYIESTETRIPLPSAYIDVLFTMNALDHCSKVESICREIMRIFKPGGTLIASFNLNEPGTFSEPQTLSEQKLDRILLHAFEPAHRELSQEGSKLHFRGTLKDSAKVH
jgi:SAM-dependent methyltransferase